MRSKIAAGASAGFVGGIGAAALLSVMAVTGRDGDIIGAITLVSNSVRSNSLLVGWLIQLAVGTVIGASFGILFGASVLQSESTACWATIYSIAWWIVGWFVVMPLPFRLTPWAAVENPSLFQIAVAGMLACLGYGAVLAGILTWLVRRPPRTTEESERARRA